ncbi:MAG: CPBP family glutamic-type intramembrane protease, partial [Verrucomicrobiota bacterium]
LFQGWWRAGLGFHLAAVLAGFFTLQSLALSKGFSGPPLTAKVEAAAGPVGIGFCLYFLLLNPLFEELFWRGLMARPTRSLALEDVAFGTFHALILLPFLSTPYILGFVLALSGIAWVWRQIRFEKQGLAVPWMGHVLGDALFVALMASLMT